MILPRKSFMIAHIFSAPSGCGKEEAGRHQGVVGQLSGRGRERQGEAGRVRERQGEAGRVREQEDEWRQGGGDEAIGE